jgi:hypothetical protein
MRVLAKNNSDVNIEKRKSDGYFEKKSKSLILNYLEGIGRIRESPQW